MSKPDWKEAPKWAQWLAQDGDGDWCWWESTPTPFDVLGYWMPGDDSEFCVAFEAPGGTKVECWGETLERRPVAGKECK